jgi:hypothetical protein
LTEKAEILRESVLDTLRANGVAITESKASEGQSAKNKSYILEKDGNLEEQTFPPRLGRRHLNYLKRHFGVPIHAFYNAPAAIPGPVAVAKANKTA